MAAHLATVRSAISHALPYVIPTIADRIARQAAPMVVKEANHWAKRAGIDYRIVSSATKHRRKLAKIRQENMYYTPEQLQYIYRKQGQRGPTPQQQMNLAGAGKEMYPPMVGPPTLHQAERATKFPGTVYRQFQGVPVTKEMYENMQRRATRARGRQYNANPCQVDPGPPPTSQDPNPRDSTVGEEGYHIVEGSDPRQKLVPYDPHEYVSEQYEFGLPDDDPPAPLPPIGPVEPSPSPYLSLPAPPSMPLPKALADATIQPQRWGIRNTHMFASNPKENPFATKKNVFKSYKQKYKYENNYGPSKKTLRRLAETKEQRSARLVASLEKRRKEFVPPEKLGPNQSLKEVIKEYVGSSIPKNWFDEN